MVYIVGRNLLGHLSVPSAYTPSLFVDEQLLRKRIAELQDYRRLGILTASDASRYEKMRVERVSFTFDTCSLARHVIDTFDGNRWQAIGRRTVAFRGSHPPSPNALSGGIRMDASMILLRTEVKEEQTLTPTVISLAPVSCHRSI